jgi:hypothetical protein
MSYNSKHTHCSPRGCPTTVDSLKNRKEAHVSIASLILPLDFKLVNANFCTPTNSVKHALRTCKDVLHQFSRDQYNERFSSYEMSPKTQLKFPLLLFDLT